jgi:catechol 2,3-dioxygenase-like lactoylglutathione lyase family enzyme
MFDHVTIHVSDRAASEQFFATVLRTLGIERTHSGDDLAEWDVFSLAGGGDVTRRLHIGFAAPSRAHVDEFWRVGTAAGYRDDGAPGPRPQYREDYYGGFLLDPDGNSAEAVHHGDLRRGGVVDHIWIRVADLAAARDSYEAAGLPLRYESPERVRFGGENGSFSLVLGTPTEGLEVSFERP